MSTVVRGPIALHAGACVVRSAQPDDVRSIARHANNVKVWLHLRDAFPHPYDIGDAKRFVRTAMKQDPETHFVIEVDEIVVGAIGYRLQDDVDRASAEIGYWVAEEYWGRGIATAALAALTAFAFERHDELHRIYALPFADNAASSRVLEKVGYRLEGRLHHSAIKNGHLTDQLQYAANRDAWEPPEAAPKTG